MKHTAQKHRDHIASIINNLFDHQLLAAQRSHDALSSISRAVVVAAEMQSGKSGIALGLACLQRLSLSDEDLCNRQHLKDTLYLVTMADAALLAQAKSDLLKAPNVVVSNFSHFQQALKTDFKYQSPKLIIIDECHYGSGANSIRYSRIFDYLENDNTTGKVAFISATPFSALYAAGSESILRHHFHTKLIFHKTGPEYHGIRQMHRAHQVIKLDRAQRDFCDDSLMRRNFIDQYLKHGGAGWALVRVPGNSAKIAKQILLKNGIAEEQIFIIGQCLSDSDESELTSLQDFKKEFESAKLFDDKLIAITVAGFRAGINFGQEMKEHLIATWDSTIANIAAVVQANIGRACGYHNNRSAKHYTNLDAISAYSELLDHLESSDNGKDFAALQTLFEKICNRYDITGFDRGTPVLPQASVRISHQQPDQQRYLTADYCVVPALLCESAPDFTAYTKDELFLQALAVIRQEYLKEGEPYTKTKRALRGEQQNWINAQWVNGVSYDNFDLGNRAAKPRILNLIQQLQSNEAIEFNDVLNLGGGEASQDKQVAASIFSIYNTSSQLDKFKLQMSLDDVHEMCDALNVPGDNTLIVLFKRGESITDVTQDYKSIERSRIKPNSVFDSQN